MITPTKSLKKDQVNQVNARVSHSEDGRKRFPCGAAYSLQGGLSREVTLEVLASLEHDDQRVPLLYCTPEKFCTHDVKMFLKKMHARKKIQRIVLVLIHPHPWLLRLPLTQSGLLSCACCKRFLLHWHCQDEFHVIAEYNEFRDAYKNLALTENFENVHGPMWWLVTQ